MSEDKKPKKDLRARLGRTIAPNTPGAAPIAAPAGVIAPPTAAPVAAPGGAPAAARPVAPPQGIAPPMAAPASRTPFGGADIAPPPFARPAPAAEPKPEPRRRSADPFAAGPAAADQVRLVIDEAPGEDPSAARRRSSLNFALVAIFLVVGAVVGAGASTANGSRNLYNITVRDGHDVFTVFDGASHVVLEAQQHMDAIAASAAGGADHHPSVNYDEIAALVALENPLHAGAFARKNYNRFPAETVDDLFAYDHDVQELWEDFTHLNGITSGPARRATLDQTAAATVCPADLGHDDASANAAIQAAQTATSDAANAQYVALVAATDDGTIQGSLGFAETDFDATTHQATDRIFMRAARGGPGRPFDRWTPGTAFVGTAPAGVIAIDGPGSAAILGERIGSFRAFAQSLEESRTLMRETLEIQQRLTTALGEIHNLQEEFAF